MNIIQYFLLLFICVLNGDGAAVGEAVEDDGDHGEAEPDDEDEEVLLERHLRFGTGSSVGTAARTPSCCCWATAGEYRPGRAAAKEVI